MYIFSNTQLDALEQLHKQFNFKMISYSWSDDAAVAGRHCESCGNFYHYEKQLGARKGNFCRPCELAFEIAELIIALVTRK